jgi:hypothetical protein
MKILVHDNPLRESVVMTKIGKILPIPAVLSVLLTFTITPAPIASAQGYTADSFCGTEANHAWKLQHEPDNGPAQIVYSDVFTPVTVCLDDVPDIGSGFKISGSTADNPWAAYPNIGQGDQWGTRPPGSWLPYRPNADGNPIASVVTNAVQNKGNHNATFDLWFNRARDARVGQNNGAEVMIWTDCHDTCFRWYNWHVTIDGIRWGVRVWTSHQSAPSGTGITWLYTAYVALTPRDSVHGLYLNPFLRNAEGHDRLKSSWWLTGVDYGFEIGKGSAGLYVRDYSLTGFGPVWTSTRRRTASARASARATATVKETATVDTGGQSFVASAAATGTDSAVRTATGTVTVIGHGLNKSLAVKAARRLAAGPAAERTALSRAQTSAKADAYRAAMVSARNTAGMKALMLAGHKALMMAFAYFSRHGIVPQ